MRVFITGASSGIGRALALHYGREGATLGLCGRRADALAALAAELVGAEAIHYRADVRDECAMRAAADDFVARFGAPDLVIANAGISLGTAAEEAADLAAFRETMAVNLFGVVHTFQPFVAAMRAAGRGTLAGIASVAGVRGLPGAGAYSASKAALVSYLESLRVELRPCGVKVVAVLPGFIATPMTAANPYPMPFLLSAEDAAGRIARVIARGARRAVVPWQMAIVAPLLGAMPCWLYDTIAVRAPRKPRRGGG